MGLGKSKVKRLVWRNAQNILEGQTRGDTAEIAHLKTKAVYEAIEQDSEFVKLKTKLKADEEILSQQLRIESGARKVIKAVKKRIIVARENIVRRKSEIAVEVLEALRSQVAIEAWKRAAAATLTTPVTTPQPTEPSHATDPPNHQPVSAVLS